MPQDPGAACGTGQGRATEGSDPGMQGGLPKAVQGPILVHGSPVQPTDWPLEAKSLSTTA